MIHSARPIVTPVANIVFCCFVLLDLKSGDGRTYVRTKCAKTIIPTGSDCGLAEWINKVSEIETLMNLLTKWELKNNMLLSTLKARIFNIIIIKDLYYMSHKFWV